jgi:predicted small metal-binding protein
LIPLQNIANAGACGTLEYVNADERIKQVSIINAIMKTLSCRDAGCDCDYVAKGETEEDVLRDAAQHGMKEHGKTDRDMIQMQDNLRASIRNS